MIKMDSYEDYMFQQRTDSKYFNDHIWQAVNKFCTDNHLDLHWQTVIGLMENKVEELKAAAHVESMERYDERRVDDEGNVTLYKNGEFVGVEW